MKREMRDTDTIRLLWSLRRSRIAIPELTRRAIVASVVGITEISIYVNRKAERLI